MLTNIGHLRMHVRDFDACRAIYGAELGLEEIGYGSDSAGRRMCVLAVGPSTLEIHEDPDAKTARLPTGEPMPWRMVPGSVRHLAFFVPTNDEAFEAIGKTRIVLSTSKGPSVQPFGHTYLQRSLLEFKDPSGYIVQTSEIVDPTDLMADHRKEKSAFQALVGRTRLIQGYDHINWGSSDIAAVRDLFGGKLGLREISRRCVEGAEESVYALGPTDLEMFTVLGPDAPTYGPGIVTEVGFWADDVDGTYRTLKDAGVSVGDPPALVSPVPGYRKRAFAFPGPDGVTLEIAERL